MACVLMVCVLIIFVLIVCVLNIYVLMTCVLNIYVLLICILQNPVLRRLVWNRIRMPDIRTAFLTKLPCVLIKMSTLPTNHNIPPIPADCTA